MAVGAEAAAAPRQGEDAAHPPPRRLADSTPDLVLDLPGAPDTDAEPALEPEAEPARADTFAHNQDTLRKNTRARGVGEEVVEAGAEAAPEGSPVPARNTARVAAKFAELTLTGGSLKPALAAKPALLRRPTPHPRHPAPVAPVAPAAPAPDGSATEDF